MFLVFPRSLSTRCRLQLVAHPLFILNCPFHLSIPLPSPFLAFSFVCHPRTACHQPRFARANAPGRAALHSRASVASPTLVFDRASRRLIPGHAALYTKGRLGKTTKETASQRFCGRRWGLRACASRTPPFLVRELSASVWRSGQG